MTPFSSTIVVGGGWVKRHPPYEVAGLANKHRIYRNMLLAWFK
jgi:hypothetical protein